MYTMALVSTGMASVFSSMMGWGLYELLGAEERGCMRRVCSELRHAVDTLIDKLVLPLYGELRQHTCRSYHGSAPLQKASC